MKNTPSKSPSTGSSWEAFVDRLKKAAPMLRPVEKEQQWERLYYIYLLGYNAALDSVKSEFQTAMEKGKR